MALRLALFTVVFVLEICFVLIPHAQAMLPDIASFTLDHELSCIGIFLILATYAARNTLLLLVIVLRVYGASGIRVAEFSGS